MAQWIFRRTYCGGILVFYEYAIDPAVLTSFDRVRYFFEAMEPGEGRFLCEYPSKWCRLVFDQLPNIAGSSRKAAELTLTSMRTKLIRRKGVAYDSAHSWVENVVAENSRLPFRAVVTETGADHENHVCAATITIADPRWAKFTSFVPRRRADIIEAIALLLRQSASIVIIDRFFGNSSRERVDLLGAFAAVADVDTHFEVYCEPLESGDTAKRQLRLNVDALGQRLRARQRLTVRVLTKQTSGTRFHNRYVLAQIGGVNFGDSIELGYGKDKLTPLTAEQLADLRRDYCATTTAFVIEATFTVSASR